MTIGMARNTSAALPACWGGSYGKWKISQSRHWPILEQFVGAFTPLPDPETECW